ncbi:MAG: carboxylate-amine ligase [Anaerolineae bacterium]|jgi:carboxylate-amine ligase|nr:MAG: carboxylate-amine ligase [Anaerolineae bacterium]MCL4878785.1 carboxylate-amine ligase [Anaerolineae bacterium]
MPTAPLTIGIEEEYQIIDPETRELTSYVQKLMDRGRVVLGNQIKNEFMQSQVEVGSRVCQNIKEAREEIIHLRRTIRDIAREHGKSIAAAGTHPFSRWQDQQMSEGERYDDLLTTMQDSVRRLLIFGTHVHIGFGKDRVARELTIDILNQIRYFLPHILALSTSSPFWHGRNTGMKSYRSKVFENMPRSGISPTFNSYAEYDNYVDLMARVGALGREGTQKLSGESGIKDATKIWWDARPHPNWGTLEIRIADMCTTVDEAISIAAFIQALVAKLIQLRNQNRSWRIYRTHVINENKWRAVRYGIDGELIDFGCEAEVPMRNLAQELVELVDDVVDELDSREEVAGILKICETGTSADRQVAVYNKAIADGAAHQDALRSIVDNLIYETGKGWE